MSKREDRRRERALHEVEFCDGCGFVRDGRSRRDAARERMRLDSSPAPLRVS